MWKRLASLFALALIVALLPAASAPAQVVGNDVLYTTDADFDLGTSVSVNHDFPFNDQLQLDSPTEPFPFINVAASGRGTVVRVNTDTGAVVGEYRTAPEGRGLNPSRTTVDLFGNVWTANREEVGEIEGTPAGSAVKIGLIVGGMRVDETGVPNPSGGYLAPPFGYSTCIDRDSDGLIHTSAGLFDAFDWPDVTDGVGGADGLVEDAVDECILIYQRLPDAEQARHVSVDADNNVWVGGFPFELRHFFKLDGTSGAFLDSFDARDIGCGGYGGLIDGNGVLWSIGWGSEEGALLRYDPATRVGSCVNIYGGYGLGIDTNGYVWGSLWENGISKVSPGGILEPGFPKWTVPPSAAIAWSPRTQRAMTIPLAVPGNVNAADVADPDSSFVVSAQDDWVQSQGPWTAGATISLTIADGSGVVYSDSQTADGSGYFNFNLGGVFDLERGHVVTVSDGATKIHTVTNLFVTGVDLTAETVSGTADAGTDVHVWVNGVDGMDVTADSSGNWTADFSAVADITAASSGGAQQTDDDGDTTHLGWQLPSFQVAPDGDWVQSQNQWTAGATISLTIADGSGVVYTDTQTADSNGHFNFNLGGVFDLERGHVVTVSDGTTTKIHTVMDLFVDGVDVTADTVFGRADAGANVDVWVHDDGNLTTTADGSGNWVADFSGMTDLTYTSDGGSQVSDDDGDSTGVWWASPSIWVAPEEDWVQSQNQWTAGATISLTIADGSGVVYTDTQTADSNGHFNFNFQGTFDLERGHVVTVSDGTTTKTHTVMDLFVDGVDVTADTVFGTADAGTEVYVWVHSGGDAFATADGSGNWVADFSGVADLTYASDGGSQQSDDDGDSTGVWWASPSIQVHPDDDAVGAWQVWDPGVSLSLIIEDGSGTELFSDSTMTDDSGDFWVQLQGTFDVLRGHVVKVSDGTTTKTHEVFDLFITDVDFDTDEVFGTADPGARIEVNVHGVDHSWRTVTADGSGEWSADFSTLAGEGEGIADIVPTSEVGANQFDDDFDVTQTWWRVPRFRVGPESEEVSGDGWLRNATVTIYIDADGNLGNGWDHRESADTDDWGNFGTNVGYDIVIGHYVTVTDGETTKIHVVTGVDVTNIDTAADTIMGTAEPGADVHVSAGLFGDWSDRFVQADSSGNWVADFSVGQDGNPVFDITDETSVNVEEFDDDGDATTRNFGPEIRQNRGLAVTPIDNHVWVANSGTGTVTRLDNDGNVLTVIDTGNSPTGVAVDAAGKVWVTNQGSDNTVRVDPTAGLDGLGAVDLTVDLGDEAAPYNYSDMTGAVVVGSTSPQGFWTVIQDSGETGFEWGRVTWNTEPEANEPAGTEIVVEIRTADSEAGLGGALFIPVVTGELFSSFGRYIEVRATLKASPGGESPVLSDVRVQPAIIEVDIDIKPGSYPNSINLKRSTGVVPVAVLGSDDFDVLTIDVTTLQFGRDLASAAHDLSNPGTYLDHLQDVNDDGFMDLVSHYVIRDIGFIAGDTEACLVGETLSGIPIHGCDSVRLLGKLK